MKTGHKLWSKEELLLAINLYIKIPFGRMHSKNPLVIELAKIIGRTPGSVAFKLVNFASMDPNLASRGIKGASNVSSLDKIIWNNFYENWDQSFEESENLLAEKRNTSFDQLYTKEIIDSEVGLVKNRLIETRLNQYRFRKLVLANYNSSCCITGINVQQILVASHITPWSKYETNRLNPSNGLCLNALHDKAFDAGLLTISSVDYTIKISSKLLSDKKNVTVKNYFHQYNGKQINIPKKFPPKSEFLQIHNDFFTP